jgi:acyl-CoA synthetase
MARTSAEVALMATDRSLMAAFRDCAEIDPEARLIVSSDDRPADIDLGSLFARGLQVGAHFQRLGIRPGDVVAVQLPNWLEWPLTWIGAAFAGAVLLPIVPIYGANELGFVLRESGARLLVTPAEWRNVDYVDRLQAAGALPDLKTHVVVGGPSNGPGVIAWEELETPIAIGDPGQVDVDDVALLVYTSGTTADPKGVQHSHRTLLSEAVSLFAVRTVMRSGAFFSPWPTGHVAGTSVMLRLLAGGVTSIVMDHWNPPNAAELIDRNKAVSFSGTPFHLSGLLDAAEKHGFDLSSLVDFQVGAAPVPPAMIARCATYGLKTYRSYGSTEHPTITYGSANDPLEKRLTTEGRLIAGCEMRIVDDEGRDVALGGEGEIVSRGPDLFVGYFRAALNEAAFFPDGWYRTGDIGSIDGAGYLHITDRKKDVIIRGGENISSREVEDHLQAHDAVAEAAVVAAPDERMGEVVCAFVVTRPGATISIADIGTFFATRGLAKQKTPERLIFIDALPRNATGKVLKQELRRGLKEAMPAA